MSIGIYKITNTATNKVYIGQSRNTASRWYQHKQSVKKIPRNDDSYLIRSFRKHGIDNFSFEVIEICSTPELNDKEQYWINYYQSSNPEYGYNRTNGGAFTRKVYTQFDTGLNLRQVNEIIQHLKERKLSLIDIAAKYSVSRGTISNINNGRTWVQDDMIYPIRPFGTRKGMPPKEELIEMLVTYDFTMTYRKLNTSLLVLKRWCRYYEIPDNKQEFYLWYQENKRTQ